jgi:hypothetical protein
MAVTSYQDIKDMSAAYKQMLATNKSTLPFDVDNSALVVMVDVATDLQAILSNNPEKLAVVIGLENDRLTICLLGHNDSSGTDPLMDPPPPPPPPPPPGQETWPDEEMIVFSEEEEYDEFFTP